MTTKHTPATPLPWQTASRRRPPVGQSHYETVQPFVVAGSYVLAECHEASGKRIRGASQDAAYIAHAANAYPKLVEALRDIQSVFSGGFGFGAKNLPAQRAALANLDALLRSLEEDS